MREMNEYEKQVLRVIPDYCRGQVRQHPDAERLMEYVSDIAQNVALRLYEAYDGSDVNNLKRLTKTYTEEEIADMALQIKWQGSQLRRDVADNRPSQLQECIEKETVHSPLQPRLLLLCQRLTSSLNSRDARYTGASFLDDLRLLQGACTPADDTINARLGYAIHRLENDANARAAPLTAEYVGNLYAQLVGDLESVPIKSVDAVFLTEIGVQQYDVFNILRAVKYEAAKQKHVNAKK